MQMTKVDFYTGSADKLRTACQLCAKAMQNGMRTVISLPDMASCDALDKLLWQYPATAFIPHAMSNSPDAAEVPVVLSTGEEAFLHHDMLISLHDACMPFFSRFERVAEIVSTDELDSRLGRERFKFYRDRGYELRHFDLARTQP
jgi:DNA polymerase-3 subunit chi